MIVLVTGNLGFIGSHLTNYLVNKGHHVVGIDDLSGGFIENINKKVDQYVFDLRDAEKTKSVIEFRQPEVIYHLAANAAENKSLFSPIDISSRSWNTFINVITPAIGRGLRTFVFTSSVAVYGANQTPFKENATPHPEDLYGLCKLYIENALKMLAGTHGFNYTIARLHNVYGKRQNMQDPYRNVVTLFMNSLLAGKPYVIYGDGNMKRCFSHVEDVVEALYKCIDDNAVNDTYNIGSDRATTIKELSDLIQKVSGIHVDPIYLPKRVNEVEEAIPDHTKANLCLKYVNSRPLKTNLERTWKWVKEQGYKEPIYKELEIQSNLVPKNWRKQ